MKKNILTHGLISGIIVSVIMLFSMNYYSYCEGSVNQSTSMLIGYASILIAFSMIFVGIRNYRDNIMIVLSALEKHFFLQYIPLEFL